MTLAWRDHFKSTYRRSDREPHPKPWMNCKAGRKSAGKAGENPFIWPQPMNVTDLAQPLDRGNPNSRPWSGRPGKMGTSQNGRPVVDSHSRTHKLHHGAQLLSQRAQGQLPYPHLQKRGFHRPLTFNLESLVLSISRLISLIPSSPGLSSACLVSRSMVFRRRQGGNGVEYNGSRRRQRGER